MKKALFIFRRDLRLHDNRGLLAALRRADQVILSFIFTPEQIEKNRYRSDRCLQFMIESLEDLESEIRDNRGRLYLFYGKPEKIVEGCIEQLGVDGVFLNHDYTPYSIQRDKKIESVCAKHGIPFQAEHDLLLHPIADTLKLDGRPYTVFTPFYRHALQFPIDPPEKSGEGRFFSREIPLSESSAIYKKILLNRREQTEGGRRAGLEILKNIGSFARYSAQRDFPALDKTTHLSPHLKFTTCSIREVYRTIHKSQGLGSELIRALYWREFFTLIALHFPHVFEGAFKPDYNRIKWKNDKRLFNLWCAGKTGFPIVDAGMRELNETGFMHNRVRMITASFLVKDLHINWQWGERYFAQHLIDYDPAVNNGNWQWCASTGCDAQPYFRVFNPSLQAKKFDPEGEYIKKWVQDSPDPIVDHSKEAKRAVEMYK